MNAVFQSFFTTSSAVPTTGANSAEPRADDDEEVLEIGADWGSSKSGQCVVA
jgi:hypothetical protein